MSLPVVAAERTMPASAADIFDVLADPSAHAAIDGSGTVREITSSRPRLELGARFGATMHLGVPYRVTNTVVEFEEGRRIAWRHFAGHRWRYILTPTDEGTLVREEWDASRLPWAGQELLKALGFPDRNRRSMEETLLRLEAVLADKSPPT